MTLLSDLVPERGFADASAALDAFLGWVIDRGIEPYPAQEEAFLELFEGHHVLLKTPTGSGKSLVALALHFRWFALARRSVYTAPIKALVSEKFFDLCRAFGAENVGLMTGDGTVNPDAPIVCCTAEVLAQMALRQQSDTPFHGVVMDEFHYYGDRDRGMAWQLPLLTVEHAQFLLMSATLGNTSAIERALHERTGTEVAAVTSTERPVPLTFLYSEKPLHEALWRLSSGSRAPVYAVFFSQSAATEAAQALLSTDICSPEEKAALKAAVKGFRFDSPFGPTLRRMALHGVGLHHAGLLPKYRLLVEKLAQQGLFRAICGTDTLGVGINVPIRTVLFTQLCKYDGVDTDLLTVRDFHQIAGRAGRKGFDDEGVVVAQAPDWVIENAKLEAKIAAGEKKRSKVKKKSAPTRGYKHWDESTYERLQRSPPETLEPRFTVDHSLLLGLLQRSADDGSEPLVELDALIDRAHLSASEKAELQAEGRQRLDALLAAGVVERTERGPQLLEELQHDFSLHHSLSLFLVHAVDRLDPDADTYALDVLTLVESILEHPKPILYAQVHRDKGEKLAALKAEGVEYDERMEILQTVTWPKPRAEWIYATFAEWVANRPWVPEDPIRPKSVAREMVEQFATFSQYVKALSLDRREGVLLRYLTQVYKTLLQNVPLDRRTEEIDDVLGFLGALLARTDDSLLTEWETLLEGAEPQVLEVVAPPIDLSADPRAFRARVRAELHALVRALSVGDVDEAAASVRSTEDAWTADDFRTALQAFLDDQGTLYFDGRAKLGDLTTIQPDGDHRWQVRQRLVGDDDEAGWALEGIVDLSSDRNPSGPLVQITDLRE
jgi:superfamily II RNA helicase